MKTALVTGFTGQDGTFLASLLLEQGYRVVALCRRVSTEPPRRVRGRFDFGDALEAGLLVVEDGDLLDQNSLRAVVRKWHPDEVYNLAAQSHVGLSFKQPELTMQIDFFGVVNLLAALEECNKNQWRFYQASTSEMFGDVAKGVMLDEESRLRPNSPYAIAKTAAHYYCQSKRMQGQFVSCGILFNHESEIRGADFVTQKIARGVRHWIETAEPIRLGNLEAMRDWGYAGDYVEGMWLMLQHDTPDDFVLATGETHTIREFATAAFKAVGFELCSNGETGVDEVLTVNGKPAIIIDPQFYRPNEVGFLLGNSTKARTVLGWQSKHDFESLVKLMVERK